MNRLNGSQQWMFVAALDYVSEDEISTFQKYVKHALSFENLK